MLFAPASPSFSSKPGVLPFAARKTSLRASETGMAIDLMRSLSF